MARTTPVTDRCAWEGMEHRDLTQTPPWEEASEPGAQQPPDHNRLPSRPAGCPQRAGGQAATGGTGRSPQTGAPDPGPRLPQSPRATLHWSRQAMRLAPKG